MFPCYKCHMEKKLSEFYPDRKSKRGYRSICKTCAAEDKKKWHQDNREKSLARMKNFYSAHREDRKAAATIWRRKNKEQVNKLQKINRERFRYKYGKARNTVRYQNDPNFRLKTLLRNRFKRFVNGDRKDTRLQNLLGISVVVLLQYLNLDALYKYGIPYTGNENKFHIDHITPLCIFDLRKEEDCGIAFSWENLQILTKEENLKKGGRLTT